MLKFQVSLKELLDFVYSYMLFCICYFFISGYNCATDFVWGKRNLARKQKSNTATCINTNMLTKKHVTTFRHMCCYCLQSKLHHYSTYVWNDSYAVNSIYHITINNCLILVSLNDVANAMSWEKNRFLLIIGNIFNKSIAYFTTFWI